MNRNLEVLTKIYKPYRLERKNNVFIFQTMDGNYAIKLNPKIDYKKLYNYLSSRSFNYIPKLMPDSRDDMIVMEYQEDLEIDKNQKILDLINLVSLLHSKTFYYKEVTVDKYKEIYETIKDNILYIDNYYDNMFVNEINREIYSPSTYLFLRNYSLIYNACKYTLHRLEEWYLLVGDKTKQRVVLVHNNLKLEHMIKNTEEYLISWDQYTFDSPVLDLFNLYKNEWESIRFKEALDLYDSNFNLLDDERMLFDILISIPYKISDKDSEYERCREFRKLINYLGKSSLLIKDD